MPMPHRTQLQVIKHRLGGKAGSDAGLAAFPQFQVVAVSVLDDASLDRLRDTIWRLTGLVRVYLGDDEEPLAFRPPVTVVDVADAIHRELGSRCLGARVWGPSARFDGQKLGPTHVLQDGDTVEILATR